MTAVIEHKTYWMLVAIATLVFCLVAGRGEMSPAQAELVPALGGGGGLVVHVHEAVNGHPARVIVVDPQMRRMAVYHVPVDSGAIQLKSVRNLTIDLQVQDFNSGDPSPIDMQKTLQRQ